MRSSVWREQAFIGCLLMVVECTVSAQNSVTIYGAVDDAFTYANNQVGISKVYLRQGNYAASKLGFSGKEDLGNGLSSIFDLQAGFDPNNGAAASTGLLFNRQAYVGLKSTTAGVITVGRQYTPYYTLIGPLEPSAYLTGATGAHPGDIDGLDTTIRINNSVSYTSPVIDGLQASAMYGLGEVAGSVSKGQTISAAVRYSFGQFNLGMGYLQLNSTESSTNGAGFDAAASGGVGSSAVNVGYLSARSIRHFATAATYTIGKAIFGLNYSNVRYLPGMHSNAPFTETANFNTVGAISTYRFSDAFDVAGGVSYTKASKANGIDDAASYQQYSLKEAYHLSKRTTLYALQAWQQASGKTLNKNGAAISAVASVGDSQNGNSPTGSNQFVAMFGIAVLF